jgi:hypothetical protein
MAVKAVNNTASPNGLVPTLLVYRAYPRISKLDPPAPSVIDQAAVIWKAMAEIVKLRAKQTINNALHHRNGPNTTLVYNLPLNSKVLVWRKSGK